VSRWGNYRKQPDLAQFLKIAYRKHAHIQRNFRKFSKTAQNPQRIYQVFFPLFFPSEYCTNLPKAREEIYEFFTNLDFMPSVTFPKKPN
jgi:hypothetical protein